MINRDSTKTLARIATMTDVDALRRILDNTITLYGPDDEVALAVHRRLEELRGPIGVIEDEYMVMRDATIEVVGRDPRLKTLLDNRGPIDALVALMEKPPSAAFHKLIDRGRYRDTAEAIVDRHADYFPATAVATARARLRDA